MVNPAFKRSREKRRYWQVRPGPGHAWVTGETKAEALEYVGAKDGEKYEIREKWMSEEEFENLDEHDGW